MFCGWEYTEGDGVELCLESYAELVERPEDER